MKHFQTVISQTGMRNFSSLGVGGPSEGKTARILDGRSLHLLCSRTFSRSDSGLPGIS